MTNKGQKIEGGLQVVVDGVMRSSTGDNGMLVSRLSHSPAHSGFAVDRQN